MRIPRLRLSLRALMVLIALLALSVSAKLRHDRCMERARFYDAKAFAYRSHADLWTPGPYDLATGTLVDSGPIPRDETEIMKPPDRFQDLAVQCERLASDFERCAWNPFVPTPAEIKPEEFAGPDWRW